MVEILLLSGVFLMKTASKLFVIIVFFVILSCNDGKKAQKAKEVDKIQLKQEDRVVLAKVGQHKIYADDLDSTLTNLPSYMRSKFSTKEGKMKLLNKLITRFLLYDKGIEEGLLEEQAIKRNLEEYRISLVSEQMKSRLLAKERTPAALMDYYEKNKLDYRKGKKIPDYNEVKGAVSADLSKEILKNYIARLKHENEIIVNEGFFKEEERD